MIQFIKHFFSTIILSNLIALTSKFLSCIWSIITNKKYWSGLFPTLLLAVVAYLGFHQTKSQLKLLQEQITYVRQPRLFISPRLKDDDSTGLFIANIGNDTVQNVNVRLGLFLVTETEIYSYGELLWPMGVNLAKFNSPKPPRESLWPLLSLAPNQEEDLTGKLDVLGSLDVYRMRPPKNHSQVLDDMSAIRDSLKADYVLFVEYFCRRKTDFVGYAETTYFRYYPYHRGLMNLNLEIGGSKTINRLRSYMQNGPELSVYITRDAYEIYRNPSTTLTPSTLIKRIPRKE